MSLSRFTMPRVTLWLALALLTASCPSAQAQSEGCSKPTVAVRVWEIYDYTDEEDRGIGSVFEELNRREFKTKEDWVADIGAIVTAELKKHSPGLQFIFNGADCDYHFKFILCNYPVLYEWPDDSTGDGPDVEVAGFLMLSCFGTDRSCVGYSPHIVLCNSDRTSANQDLTKTIQGNIAYYGNIEPKLERYEARFPAPARGPKINRSHDRDYVSPLEGETELNIRVQVTNCKGEPVFDRHHREQKVLYQRKTKRAELTADRDFNYYDLEDKNLAAGYLVMGIYEPKGVSARYTLHEGINPGVDSVEIKTCGRDKDDVDTAFVDIMGLDLKAKARRREMFSMESTQIDIDFNRIDTKGEKIPIDRKTIEIKVRGLVDGKVYPTGNVVTDSQGRASITYTAGQEDDSVTFEAKFQPKGFEESVRDRARVRVIKYDRLCQITRRSTHTTDIAKNEQNTVSTMNWTETSEVTVSMTFEDNPEVDIAFDPATMQMKPNRYVYTLADYWINSSYHTGSGSSEETVGSGAYIHRHVSSSSGENGTFQDLRPSNKDARLTITVDPATGKATEVSLPFFDATISIFSEQDCGGEQLIDGKLEPFDCSSTNQSEEDFPIQPLTSDRKQCYEITGDGVKVIRGQCREHNTSAQGSKDESYEWVIYAKD